MKNLARVNLDVSRFNGREKIMTPGVTDGLIRPVCRRRGRAFLGLSRLVLGFLFPPASFITCSFLSGKKKNNLFKWNSIQNSLFIRGGILRFVLSREIVTRTIISVLCSSNKSR